MQPSDAEGDSPGVDVCLVLEGTYPYVRGGVSNWVHDLIRSLPDLRFAVVTHPVGGLQPAAVAERMETALDQVLPLLGPGDPSSATGTATCPAPFGHARKFRG